jgi:hypothetical protein
LYKNSQLEEGIYPNLLRTLQEGGFQAEGDLWDLSCTVDTLCLALILVCLAAHPIPRAPNESALIFRVLVEKKKVNCD